MASKIEICNIALSHINAHRIDSLQEASNEGLKCNMLFDNCVESVLRSFKWSFATKNILLAKLEEEFPGWSNVYQYPPTCLYVSHVFNKETLARNKYKEINEPTPYRIMSSSRSEEKVICSNLEGAWCEYISKVINTETFDSEFTNALCWRLAADLAIPLTGSDSIAMTCQRFYSQAIITAQANSANEGYTELKKDYGFINARY